MKSSCTLPAHGHCCILRNLQLFATGTQPAGTGKQDRPESGRIIAFKNPLCPTAPVQRNDRGELGRRWTGSGGCAPKGRRTRGRTGTARGMVGGGAHARACRQVCVRSSTTSKMQSANPNSPGILIRQHLSHGAADHMTGRERKGGDCQSNTDAVKQVSSRAAGLKTATFF